MLPINFHVRHEVQPERVWGVLDALANENEYNHITQYDRQLSRLRQLDLVEKQNPIQLTENGIELHRIGVKRLDIAWDIMHFLHYTQWRQSNPIKNTMFYTYKKYCDLLYSQHNVEIGLQRNSFAAEIISLISSEEYFSQEGSILMKGAVSLSTNSLLGVEYWLSKLSPEVITGDGNFTIRHYCSPELLLLALGYVSVITETQLGLEQLLSDERRTFLCQICLIEDEVLDQMLDWLFPEYPEFFQPGTSIGSYGRFIRVMKTPSLKDLLK
jgi:hypothetical protein